MVEIAGFNCRLVRRSSNVLRLSVSGSGKISVYAPKRASMKQITDFVIAHRDFLKNAIEKQISRHDDGLFGDDPANPFIYYIGERVPVIFSENSSVRPSLTQNGVVIPYGLSPNDYRHIITELYRPLTKAYVTERIKSISEEMGIGYEKLRFAQSTSRWGSCSSSGTVSFSVYLIAVPPRCIDHVIRHELAHFKVMNHSADFYDLLAKYEPMHKELQAELRSVYGKWMRKFKISAS